METVRLLKFDEVADILRISKMTVSRLVASGELEGIQVSRRVIRIPESSVTQLLASRIHPRESLD